MLPVSLSMEAGTIPCTSGDWGERPTSLVRLNEAGERYWIEKIAKELNREVAWSRYGMVRGTDHVGGPQARGVGGHG